VIWTMGEPPRDGADFNMGAFPAESIKMTPASLLL
jgi:hypothetical protein